MGETTGLVLLNTLSKFAQPIKKEKINHKYKQSITDEESLWIKLLALTL